MVAHDQWFRELHRLDEARRKAIDAWRAKQEEVRAAGDAQPFMPRHDIFLHTPHYILRHWSTSLHPALPFPF